MSTAIITYNNQPSDRYGVTERKKQEIDRLTQEVLNAQDEVEQYQAIVDSLTDKSNKLQSQLTTADNNKALALKNKDSVDRIIDNSKDLQRNSKATFKETDEANKKIKDTASKINEVIDKLIYAAEVVNKLSNLVIRKKASNPLISDELVTMVTQASSDANNAVALTLVALESVFASQATTLEAKSAMSLAFLQATKLYEFVSGEDVGDITNDIPAKTIKDYLYAAYQTTVTTYENTLTASNDTTNQLNDAKASLSKSQVKLSSLQAGLAAANAAALAS